MGMERGPLATLKHLLTFGNVDRVESHLNVGVLISMWFAFRVCVEEGADLGERQERREPDCWGSGSF